MTVLMLSTFLLILGIAFLYFVERDSYAQLQQQRATRAEYAARSGVDYFYYRDISEPTALAVGVPDGPHFLQRDEYFEITKMADGGCRSRGFIRDRSGTMRAERVLIVPGGKLGGDRLAIYDEKL
jgi:hypothetical protein